MKRVYSLGFASVLLGCLSASAAQADAGFREWIDSFRREAVGQGVSPAVYDAAFRDVNEPDPVVLEKAAYQPEFKAEVWEYLDSRVNERAIATGREKLQQYDVLLQRIERDTGVDRHVLLAIWSMESSYGAVLADPAKLHYLPRALATLAYADPKRASFGRNQLVAALKILQRGDVSQQDFLGSWAGAMGHTQFIPTSYIAYAVDGDGDGKRDIWHSVPDALATAAQLLQKNGWRSGQAWGYEVTLPAVFAIDESTRTLVAWQQAGVKPVTGKPFADPASKAELRALQGANGPAFLVMKNFFVLKAYNNADKYALAVALLADRIAGRPAPVRDWQRPYTILDLAGKEELQRLLAQHGYYSGVVDGLIGDESRRAIKRFQASRGAEQNGYPSKEVLLQLREVRK